MDDTPNRGLGPLAGSVAFALGSTVALYGGTAFAARVYRHVVEFDRLVFAEVFPPALAFVVGVAIAFGASVGVLLSVVRS